MYRVRRVEVIGILCSSLCPLFLRVLVHFPRLEKAKSTGTNLDLILHAYSMSPRRKIKLVRIDESRGLNFLFLPRPIIRTPQSSLRNVFVRRTARLLLKTTLFSLYVMITFGLAMREFLFNEKKIIGKGKDSGEKIRKEGKSERGGKRGVRRASSSSYVC